MSAKRSVARPEVPPVPAYIVPGQLQPLLDSAWLAEAFLLSADFHALDDAVDAVTEAFVARGAPIPPTRLHGNRDAERHPWMISTCREQGWTCEALIAIGENGPEDAWQTEADAHHWVACIADPGATETEMPVLVASKTAGYRDAAAAAFACRALHGLRVAEFRGSPELIPAVAAFLAEGRDMEALDRALRTLAGVDDAAHGTRVHGNRLVIRALALEAALKRRQAEVDAALAGRPAPAPVTPTPQPETARTTTVPANLDEAERDLLRLHESLGGGEFAEALCSGVQTNRVRAWVDEAMQGLVGLTVVRHRFEALCWEELGRRAHAARGGPPGRGPSLHLALMGEPGVGKTTVARRYATLLHRLGLVTRPSITEVGARDLIGKYVGSTHPRVLAKAKEAEGGVLFIDEAYALVARSDKDYGAEAVAALMQAIDRAGGNLVVVLAGYEAPLQRVLESNSGFASRIRERLTLPSLDPSAAGQLLLQLAEQDGVEVEAGVQRCWLDLSSAFELPSDGRSVEATWLALRRAVVAPRAAKTISRQRLRVADLAHLTLAPRRGLDRRWIATAGADDELAN